MTHDNPVLCTARAALAVGISVIPATEDGEKHPDLGSWKIYQERLPTREEVTAWFSSPRKGIGVVTGAVSGNLEALDFDAWETFQAFEELARATEQGKLLEQLKRDYFERTPRGAHLPYRCEQIAGNQKLAQRLKRNEQGRSLCDEHGNLLVETLIETRGEGGFLVIAPSNGTVHPSGKPYMLVSGSIATIPTITPEERAELLALARSFNEIGKEEPKESHRQDRTSAGDRPGDLFNARANWEEILAPKGWMKIYERNGVAYWRRPGKDRGVSATTNYQDSDLLYVFSTSTSFESERGYSKFSAYALLNHRNDFRKAAETLTTAGYAPETKTHWKATRALRLRRQAEETARRILAKQRGEVVA